MVTAQAATLLAWDASSLLLSAAVTAFNAPYVPPGSRPAIGAPLCDSTATDASRYEATQHQHAFDSMRCCPVVKQTLPEGSEQSPVRELQR